MMTWQGHDDVTRSWRRDKGMITWQGPSAYRILLGRVVDDDRQRTDELPDGEDKDIEEDKNEDQGH